MEEIKLEDLQSYRGRENDIGYIQIEIDAIYGSIPSGSGGGPSSQPGDPTTAKLRHIEKLQRSMERMQRKNDEIDQWLESLDDRTLASIIRAHYIIGLSWRDTAQRVCKSDSHTTPLMIVRRFFGKL